ncbi:MAG TPA: hypothetical protein VHZ24_07965 [Pirellulales bacterium]|jgi:hypothetical protein|nr:hypothetical protein [Pirellulales bacterium]
MKTIKKLPSQITISCGRDEDVGRLVLAAAEGEPAKLRRFSITAYTGGKMSLPNIPYPVVVDMSGLRVSAKSRPILRDHNPSQIVGHTDNVTVNGGVLKVDGSVSGANAHATEIVASSDNGFPWQASIGASVQKMVFVEDGEKVQVNGRSFAGPLYVARQATLGEVSFVALGADDQTSARMVASAAAQSIEVTTMKFEEWISAKGFDGAALSETQRTSLEAAFDAEQKTAAPTAVTATAEIDPVADLRTKTAAEMNRIAAIRKSAGSHADIAAKAVSEGWDETRTELEVLRASRPTGAAIHAGGGSAHVNASVALEASLCLTAGLGEESVEKWYGDRVLEAARSRDIRGATIHSLMYEVIRAAGRYVRPGKVDNDTIRAAFEADRTIQASGGEFSTISLPGILSNLANKQLLKSFEAVNTVSNTFCDTTDAVDFKAFSRYRLTANGMFEKVGQDGELKSTNLSEESYTNQLDTYGRLIALTRQQIINDDLGAFLQIPRLLGRQGALAVESAVFTLLLSNPTIGGNQFFSTANANYLSGGTSTLDLDGITAAEVAFLNQVDVAGNPVLLSPAIMLVPTTLKVIAERYYKESTILQVPANNKMVPANNPHAGKFTPVSSPYLNAQGITNQSATGWYLFADPEDVAAMSIAYFRGQRTPVIESGETDFNTLGMQWRSFFDFGVAFQDFRAAVFNAGA